MPSKKSSADGVGNHLQSADESDPKSRRQKEIEATKKLLDNANDILKEADESYLLQEKTPLEYPKFDRSELHFGPVLGIGGFCVVFEIKDIKLKLPEEVDIAESVTERVSSDHTGESGTNKEIANHPAHDSAVEKENASEPVNETAEVTPKKLSDETNTTTNTSLTVPNEVSTIPNEVSIKPESEQGSRNGLSGLEIGEDDSHYEIENARKHMEENVARNGEARYAVKRLHRDLSDLERARGMIDLALETKFLSAVWHPNIIKMRGISSGPMLSPEFFIILDRLYGTLGDKMDEWRSVQSQNKGVFGFGTKPQNLKKLMLERMIVAYDLAAAFWYMHDKMLVYRDIKPENIGFDIRGDCKVFDLGLCKGLSPALKAKEGYGYKLTPRTGSLPYMAPEVADCSPYDCKCDVFSFAILLWEILSLKTAFQGYSRRAFLERVARGNERPTVKKSWPPLTRLMLKEAWDSDPQRRPDMKRVAVMLRGDLNEMTSNSSVQNRTQHLISRSAHSRRISRGLKTEVRERQNELQKKYSEEHSGKL